MSTPDRFYGLQMLHKAGRSSSENMTHGWQGERTGADEILDSD